MRDVGKSMDAGRRYFFVLGVELYATSLRWQHPPAPELRRGRRERGVAR